MLDLSMATAWINETFDVRLIDAQINFMRGCSHYKIMPVIYADPLEKQNGRPKFGDVLKMARRCAKSGFMLWCNSDCELNDNPRKYLNQLSCTGFQRKELPDGQICKGVDMYAIPCDLWDLHLCKDIPDMFVGATMIDWWITRACLKLNAYGHGPAILNHPRHTPGNITSGEMNAFNERNFRAWATRNNVDQGLQ